MRFGKLALTVITLCLSVCIQAQTYRVAKTEIFRPQNKKVLLLSPASNNQRNIILFQTGLAVNTDGAPTSYHPLDPRGREKAINNVCNAIAVYKTTNLRDNLCFSHFGEAIGVFEQYRAHEWTMPQGYKIVWENVFAKNVVNGKTIPCILNSGEYKGYFGSLTSLKNGLPDNKSGECQSLNQLNQLIVPALVMAGGANPLKALGGKVGDLLVAYYPNTRVFVAALIGDEGPPDNLGEGSVALNMALLRETVPPKTFPQTKRLSIEDNQPVLVALFPNTNLYNRRRPYTKANIEERVRSWLREAGFETQDQFIELMMNFKRQL